MNNTPQTQSTRLAGPSATPHIIPFHRSASPAEQHQSRREGKAATNIPTHYHNCSLGDLSSLGRLAHLTPIGRNVLRSNGLDRHPEPGREGSAHGAALLDRMPALSNFTTSKQCIAIYLPLPHNNTEKQCSLGQESSHPPGSNRPEIPTAFRQWVSVDSDRYPPRQRHARCVCQRSGNLILFSGIIQQFISRLDFGSWKLHGPAVTEYSAGVGHEREVTSHVERPTSTSITSTGSIECDAVLLHGRSPTKRCPPFVLSLISCCTSMGSLDSVTFDTPACTDLLSRLTGSRQRTWK